MDDDIDIEEHDVLDNPRIKDIFPDLSRVKIEISDDEDVQETQADQHSHFFYQNFNVSSGEDHAFREYVDNIKTEPDTQFVSDNYEIHNTDHSDIQNDAFNTISDENKYTIEIDINVNDNDEDVVFVNEFDSDTDVFAANKIILGSKPTVSYETTSHEIILGSKPNNCEIILGTKPDYDTLYMEALNSNTIVTLEDWGVKLETNRCFCQECKILFPTVNALDAHKMMAHSFLIALDVQNNTARKSTAAKVTGKFCNHCNLTFPDDTSLIKHLYELLPAAKQFDTDHNELDKVVETQVAETMKGGYKCILCKLTFATKYATLKHRRMVHPNVIQSQLFVREPKELETKSAISLERNSSLNNLISKWALFQCPKCRISFMTVSTALQHTRYCLKRTPSYVCRCKRKIFLKDKESHELQHWKNKHKIKQYIVYDRIYEKILNKCPKCLICFSEFTFATHYRSCQFKKPQLEYLLNKCAICDLNIESSKFQIHQQRHNRFTKEDFIVLEFIELSDAVAKKKLQITDGELEDVKADKINVYYCKHCRCCKSLPYTTGHVDEVCVTMRDCEKKQCELCGLTFTKGSMTKHGKMHDEKPLTLSNFTIFDLFTGQEIPPPVNDLNKCGACEIIFFNKTILSNHICKKEKYEICYPCDKKYNLQAYEVHKHFHPKEENIMAELIKTYNSINETWNVMYKCIDCRVATMSYDSAVEHSQKHINNLAGEPSVRCLTCALNIEESYYNIHHELHATNPSTPQPFNILKYKYNKLFKDEWMTLFNSLSKQDVDIILSKSIYKDVRRVKMNYVKKSDSDTVKFYCNNCKIQVVDVNTHLYEDCQPSDKYKCVYCNKVIKTLQQLVDHEAKHGDSNDNPAIVTFNDEKDIKFNNKLLKYATNDDSVNASNQKAKKKYKFYKCSKCSVCFVWQKILRTHSCNANVVKKFCNKCDEYINTRSLKGHKLAHEMHPNLCKKNIAVVLFEGKVKVGRQFKFFKCKHCDVSVGSNTLLAKHRCVVDGMKHHCSKCNLYFTLAGFKDHNRLHTKFKHLNRKNISVENFASGDDENEVTDTTKKSEAKAKYLFYQCSKCHLSCTKRMSGRHQCHDIQRYCQKCDLYFAKSYYKTHLQIHRDHCDLSKETIDIKVLSERRTKLFRLYRCSKCKACMRKTVWMGRHICRNKSCYRHCDVCDLYFLVKSYHSHKKLHESYPNISKEDFAIFDLDGNGKIVKSKKVSKQSKPKLNKVERELKSNGAESKIIKKSICKPKFIYGGKFRYFTCRKCNISLATSPARHKRCIRKKSVIRYCGKCNLYLTSYKFAYHKYAHAKYPTLCSKNIIIHYIQNKDNKTPVTDDLYESETEQNLEVETLSDEETHNNTEQNIDGDTYDETEQNLGDETLDDGESHNNKIRIYKCRQCSTCVYLKKSMPRHHCESASQNQYCEMCQIYVRNGKSFVKHKKLHDIFSTMNKNTLNIIEFDSRHPPSSNCSQTEESKKYTLYKCFKCKLCALDRSTLSENTHKCLKLSMATYCKKCRQYFAKRVFRAHIIWHLKHRDLNPKNITIKTVGKSVIAVDVKDKTANEDVKIKEKVDVKMTEKVDVKMTEKIDVKMTERVDVKMKDAKSEKDISYSLRNITKPEKNTVTVYKCSCGLHFTSLVAIQKHMNVCGDSEVFKEKCSKCSLVFPTDILVTHLVNHHSSSNPTILVKAVHKTILYKCPNCDTCFDDKKRLYEHKDAYCNKEDVRKCINCGIPSIRAFIKKKHRCVDTDTDVFINKIVEVEKPLEGIIAYKCVPCDLHFMTIHQFQYHLDLKHKTKLPVRPCSICGLTFSCFSYSIHLKEHQKVGYFKIKVVIPETGGFEVLTGENPELEVKTPIKRKITDLDDSSHSDAKLSRSLRVKKNEVDYCEADNNSLDEEIDVTDEIEDDGTISRNQRTLFRCYKCLIHFLDKDCLRLHVKRYTGKKCGKVSPVPCGKCGLKFGQRSLKKHKFEHHELMKLGGAEDFIVKSDHNVVINDDVDVPTDITDNYIDFATNDIHFTSNDTDFVTNDTTSDMRLFKCDICNVCFTTKEICINHLNEHEVLDPRFYIQCKICQFQFMITSLQDHMDLHHAKDLSLDDLLVENYSLVDGLIKFDIYNATHMVQSKMVSTTTDVDDVSSVDEYETILGLT